MVRGHGLGEAEVEDLDRAIGTNFDVGRLQIAVHDALLVRVLHGLGDLPGDVERVAERQRARLEQVCQRAPFDEFHHQGRDAVAVFEPVDVRDVRMVEQRQRVRFTREPGDAFGVTGDRRGQDFDGDLTIQGTVECGVDFAHPARTEAAGDFVLPDARAGAQAHVSRVYRRSQDGRAKRRDNSWGSRARTAKSPAVAGPFLQA